MILRDLSPAKPGCMNDLRSIFEALQAGECALAPLRSLLGHTPNADCLSHVGGMAGKLALNIGNEGILTVRRSSVPIASSILKRVPLVGGSVNQILSASFDLLGGKIEPDSDAGPISGLFREVAEEGIQDLPMLDKDVLVGCYAKATTHEVTAVVRLGVAAALSDLPELNLSSEHTSAELMLPSNPRFPAQWSELGHAAMEKYAA
ncbi:MAG: hypothetical protein QG623_156 [Patescibacteria group bacterium]|nr:hypothetical protein [Patescibacteria group bacterium]